MKKGFTLIELSIVLVIIGLLVGAVTVGQSLLRASKIRGAIGEYDRTIKAVGEFRDKYYALPGDMNNAESFWGSDANCPNTANNTVPKIATCNGNGDGRIGTSSITGPGWGAEWFRAWQQLANAGFIDGHFTGAYVSPLNGGGAVLGVNVPKSSITGAGWTLLYYLFPDTGSQPASMLWPDEYGHLLVLGAPVSLMYTYDPALTAAEASALDQKLDDGKPGTGKIHAPRYSTQHDCTDETVATQIGSVYKNTNKANACSLFFTTGF